MKEKKNPIKADTLLHLDLKGRGRRPNVTVLKFSCVCWTSSVTPCGDVCCFISHCWKNPHDITAPDWSVDHNIHGKFCFLNKWLWNDVFKIHFYWLRYRTIAEKKIAGNKNLPPLAFTWAGSRYSFRSGFLPRFYWTANALCLSQQASRQMWSLFAVKVSANEFGQVQCSSNTGLKNPRHNAQLAARWRQRDVKKAAAVSQWWRSLLIYF